MAQTVRDCQGAPPGDAGQRERHTLRKRRHAASPNRCKNTHQMRSAGTLRARCPLAARGYPWLQAAFGVAWRLPLHPAALIPAANKRSYMCTRVSEVPEVCAGQQASRKTDGEGAAWARVRDSIVRTVAELGQRELVRVADVHHGPNTCNWKSGACAGTSRATWGGCAFEPCTGDEVPHSGVWGRG